MDFLEAKELPIVEDTLNNKENSNNANSNVSVAKNDVKNTKNNSDENNFKTKIGSDDEFLESEIGTVENIVSLRNNFSNNSNDNFRSANTNNKVDKANFEVNNATDSNHQDVNNNDNNDSEDDEDDEDTNDLLVTYYENNKNGTLKPDYENSNRSEIKQVNNLKKDNNLYNNTNNTYTSASLRFYNDTNRSYSINSAFKNNLQRRNNTNGNTLSSSSSSTHNNNQYHTNNGHRTTFIYDLNNIESLSNNRNMYNTNNNNYNNGNSNNYYNIRNNTYSYNYNTSINDLNGGSNTNNNYNNSSNEVDYFAEKPSLMQRCSSVATTKNPLYKFWCSPSPLATFRRRLREKRVKNERNKRDNRKSRRMPQGQRIAMGFTTLKKSILGYSLSTSLTANSNRIREFNTPVRMVTSAGFVKVSDASQPLVDLTADVVNCFAVGDECGEALVLVMSNNILRVYTKMNYHYIPSIEAILPFGDDSVPTNFSYNKKTKTGIIGSSKGIIIIFEIDTSLNSLVRMANSEKFFADSIKRTAYLPESGIILATNGYHLYTYDSNSLVVRNQMPSKSPVKSTYTCIEVSPTEDTIFLGTSSGTVEILDHNKGNTIFKSMLKGHDYEITAIHFVKEKSMLFTGDKYGFIQMWFLQAGQHMINLFHHQSSILSLETFNVDNKFYLASICKENLLVHWDLNRERKAPVTWNKSQECETCTKPFYFNIKKLWSLKQLVGERRHHCRSCGKSICQNCTARMDRLPQFGLEVQSNSCYDCRASYTDEELQSTIIEIQGEDNKIKKANFSSYRSSETKSNINCYTVLSGNFYQTVKLKNLFHE